MYYALVVENGAVTGLNGQTFAAAFDHVPAGSDASDASAHVWRFPKNVYHGVMSLLDNH